MRRIIRYPDRMRALIFDLDGTLVDTVYGHTLAWLVDPRTPDPASKGQCAR